LTNNKDKMLSKTLQAERSPNLFVCSKSTNGIC